MYIETLIRRFGLFAAVVILGLVLGAVSPVLLAQAQTDGTDGTASSTPATVLSGDANAQTDQVSQVNTNEIDGAYGPGLTDIANSNAATTSAQATSSAETGENSAVGGGGVLVDTGGAYGSANVINVVNTNLVNSNGLLAFLNAFFGQGLDLRTFDLTYFFGGSGEGECSLYSCGGSLSVQNQSDALVDNTVVVRSATGENTASSTLGDATIMTGDAYAWANVVNVVNTNFVNSNYLLLAFNNFGDMSGDITLPNADFFRQLSLGAGLPSGDVDIANTNTADVANDVMAEAATGENAATSTEGGAAIVTGDAYAAATTYNQVNSNRIGGRTVYMLVNVFGGWTGSVQGLPEGFSWAPTQSGIVIKSDDGDFSELNSWGNLSVANENNASVYNNVQVWALTGENKASGGSGAQITTGDAYAVANVVNIINTNVIGQNWIFAMFNIFGNWSGNFSFGHPDLWIGGAVETPNPTPPGTNVKYCFTVSNRGDADAHSVVLRGAFDRNYLSFGDGSQETYGVLWRLGDIARGATGEFCYRATAGQGNGIAVPLEATVTAQETDQDMADNTERLSILIGLPPTVGAQPGPWTPLDPKITMVKEVSDASVVAPDTVDYTIVIKNEGGKAYDTTLQDVLRAPSGKEVYSQNWTLDTIFPGETVTLTYSVEIPQNAEPGLYTNTAVLAGGKYNPVDTFAPDMTPVVATTTVEVMEGAVLGAQISPPVCAMYLTSYIKWGVDNNAPQVRRLQYFLRDFEGAGVSPTGVYDIATLFAVDVFQRKYYLDVLQPWGAGDATGYVYYTTSKKINELYCQGVSEFPLTDFQLSEIEQVKSGKRRF